MRRSDKVGYWFVVPAFLFMAMFMFYPVVYNAILSMQHVDVMTLLSKEKEFVLFDNYVKYLKIRCSGIRLRILLFLPLEVLRSSSA